METKSSFLAQRNRLKGVKLVASDHLEPENFDDIFLYCVFSSIKSLCHQYILMKQFFTLLLIHGSDLLWGL